MEVLENHVGSCRGNSRVAGKILEHKFSNVIVVSYGQVDNEIFRSTEKENLDHFRQVSHFFHKVSEVRSRSRSEGHRNKYLARKPNSGGIYICGEAANHSSSNQRSNPGNTGGLSNSDRGGEVGIGRSRVLGQKPKQLVVYLI